MICIRTKNLEFTLINCTTLFPYWTQSLVSLAGYRKIKSWKTRLETIKYVQISHHGRRLAAGSATWQWLKLCSAILGMSLKDSACYSIHLHHMRAERHLCMHFISGFFLPGFLFLCTHRAEDNGNANLPGFEKNKHPKKQKNMNPKSKPQVFYETVTGQKV